MCASGQRNWSSQNLTWLQRSKQKYIQNLQQSVRQRYEKTTYKQTSLDFFMNGKVLESILYFKFWPNAKTLNKILVFIVENKVITSTIKEFRTNLVSFKTKFCLICQSTPNAIFFILL